MEAHGLRHREVKEAEGELEREEPQLFLHVKRSSYEDGKTWAANMDEAGWEKHRQAKARA